MPAKSNPRNWNDVQTAIATAAIVTTLGLWNLFATPPKTETVKSSEPVTPPTEQPEVEVRVVAPLIATPLPQVKIMFTPGASQTTVQQQAQNINQQQQKKKKKNKDNNSNGGGSVTTVTQTKTS